eukprot:1449312-Rhodomonas_salina.1
MLLQCARVNARVIDELAHVACVDVLPQHVRHVALEGRRRVGQAELHYTKLKLTEGGSECSLVP